MRDFFSLDLPALPHAIAVARAAAAALAAELALAEARATRLELALEETVANAVHHAYPDGRPGRLRVSARQEGSALVLRVQDWGVPYHLGPAGAAIGIGMV
uniref:ATP-binding protein n=1 Tax=Roseomonas sp. 18066 TaxID=2681412 RepID=UPI00190F154E